MEDKSHIPKKLSGYADTAELSDYAVLKILGKTEALENYEKRLEQEMVQTAKKLDLVTEKQEVKIVKPKVIKDTPTKPRSF